MTDSLPRGYRPWLIACVAVLVASLGLLGIAVTAAFVSFSDKSAPVWDVVLGALAVFGIVAGFSGLFLLLAAAAFSSWREARRVQILPPLADDGEHTNT